ncbi:MAG: cation:dicarboxylase symporter family transporter [Acidobacteria bacterium]|nr:cation:dicarboxylase symporter family transporter [Acidobacteriota bacterium]
METATNKDHGTTRRVPLSVQAAGFALFVFGFILIHFVGGHVVPACIRWAGLVLLVFIGIRRRSLTFWIFFAMLAGLEIGLDWPAFAVHLKLLSDIFLRLIKVIVAPLILGTLITGVAGHGDIRKVGRIGWKSLLYFEAMTTIALVLGIAAINLTRAGEGLVLPASSAEPAPQSVAQLKWDDFVLHIFPENIVKSIAENQILQVAVFSILFAMALSRIAEKYRTPILSLAESLTQTMFSFTNLVMYYAPIGVGAAMAYTVGHMGLSVLLPLAKLLSTAYGTLLVFLVCVLLPVAIFTGVPLKRFLGAVAEPATIAFATSTSEAALPRAMECMESFGVPRRIVAFVIPAGYSFNLDGSTLYLALASIFVAQAAGIHMSWREQLFMVFALMLTSKGVAGVPRAVLVVLLATSSLFHLPTEPIFVILGVDALIDMARTSVNVIGNCLASAVIARWEGELAEPQNPE